MGRRIGMKAKGIYASIKDNVQKLETKSQEELLKRIVAASNYINEQTRKPNAGWIISSGNLGIGTESPSVFIDVVGSSNKGPKNKPIFIDNADQFYNIFGKPDKRKINRIFNENDPYGEENWEE